MTAKTPPKVSHSEVNKNPMRIRAAKRLPTRVALFGWLALTSCDRTRRTADVGNGMALAASPLSSTSSSAHVPDAAPARPVSVARASPAVAGCSPLERAPTTKRRALSVLGKYDSRGSILSVLSPDPAITKELNSVIASNIAQMRRAFTAHAEETIVETRGDPEPVTPDRMGQEIKCDLAGATTTVLSIECTNSRYFGGPYPGMDHFVYNFGLCAGKHPEALTLAALCRPDVKCEKTILDLISRELSARNVDVKLDEHAEALKTFAITQAGLRFFANDDLPHVIASAGTIDIAFAQLRNVLRDDGPLAGLVVP
ncbi:MAG: hypothetical protein M3O50_03675 [Myxococcota bacterium]|nr:hypothetical protein [Myxococcota bacterium]